MPKRFSALLSSLAVLALFSSNTIAQTITFDEVHARNTGIATTGLYSDEGVTFDNRNSGTFGGNANGNLGNWGLNGDNGPNFLGNNGQNNGGTFTESIFFSTAQRSVSVDVSRSNGTSADQSMTLNAFGATNNLLATETLFLGNINTWITFSLAAVGITRLDLMGSHYDTGFGANDYGIDNLQFATPEPSSIVLLLMGAAGLLLAARRRR